MTNSQQKGKRGELDCVHWLIRHGFKARRGQQFKGTEDSPDVIANIPFHIEVKFRESLNLHKAMEQAASEAPSNTVPMIYHRKNRTEPLVTMRADDWAELVKAVHPTEKYG